MCPYFLCLLTQDADRGSEADYKELNMWMDMMKENFVDKGIPVIVGEYGCFGSNKTKEVRQQWTTDVATAIHSRQMCPILRDTSGDEYQRIIKKFKNPEFIAKLIAIEEE